MNTTNADSVAAIVRALVHHIEMETCTHEETHRGGAIWEICNSCGAKWADDNGGKPTFKWPAAVEAAHDYLEALASAPQQLSETERELRRMLCVQYAGVAAYMDDGEAQDSREMPTIDFMRDSPKEIQAKMMLRNARVLASHAETAPQQPVDEREAMHRAFVEAICPYKGAPDPWVVWQAAWKSHAALSAPQAAQAVPQGWKLVPVEPTEEMLVCGQEAWAHRPRGAVEDCHEAAHIYRAMLATAPSAPAAQGEPSDEDKALDLLAVLFDAYEHGVACYEDPEETTGYLGHAVRLDSETFHACADLLNRRRPVIGAEQREGGGA